MVANIESSIWERVVEPSWDDLSPDAAQAILRLRFRQTDVDRMDHLAERARDGALSPEERREAESYEQIGRVLAIMQSKARLALRGAGRR